MTPPGRRSNCRDCGKSTWATRRDARRAARVHCPGEKGLNEYRCPHGDGGWHFGHLTPGVRDRHRRTTA